MRLGVKIFNKKNIGDAGENYAASYLKRNRYKIIERKFRTKYGEIDIICSKKGTLYFVEVKARSNEKYGAPAEAVNYFKQKKILGCAKYYLLKNNISDMFISFDVIEVYMDNNHKPIKLNHIKNAFGDL